MVGLFRREELQHKACIGKGCYLGEPEQDFILGDGDEDMGLVNGIIDPFEDKNQLRDLMFEKTKEVVRPYDFKTNDWCMVAYFLDMRDDRLTLS